LVQWLNKVFRRLWLYFIDYRLDLVDLDLRDDSFSFLYPSDISNPDIITITALQLPKPHIAAFIIKIVVLIRICWFEPCGTKIAEMCFAFEANHVIAAMSLLSRSSTCWARCSVEFQIFQRRFVFLGELLSVGPWGAKSKFAVPSLIAATTKSKRTVLANRQ
jgi:hypothetical protein